MPFLIETILDDIPTIYKLVILTFMVIFPNTHHLVPILDQVTKKNKMKSKWINFLRYDKKIELCMHNVKKRMKHSWKYSIGGSVIGYIYITILFIVPIFVVSEYIQSLYHLLVSISISLVLPIYFLLYAINECISNIASFADISRNHNYLIFTSSFTFVSTFAIILFLIFTMYAYGSSKSPDFITMGILYLFVIIYLVVAKRYSNRIYKDLTHKLESMSLEKYSEAFPHIYVKAAERELQGKVQDIFNDNFLVFGYNGLKIPVEWDKITSIKLSERTEDECEAGSS